MRVSAARCNGISADDLDSDTIQLGSAIALWKNNECSHATAAIHSVHTLLKDKISAKMIESVAHMKSGKKKGNFALITGESSESFLKLDWENISLSLFGKEEGNAILLYPWIPGLESNLPLSLLHVESQRFLWCYCFFQSAPPC